MTGSPTPRNSLASAALPGICVLVIGLAGALLIASCGVPSAKDVETARNEDRLFQADVLAKMPADAAVELRESAPSFAKALYAENGRLIATRATLNLAVGKIEMSGGLFEQGEDGTWSPIARPRLLTPKQVMRASRCTYFDWLVVDDAGDQLAAGASCGRRPIIVWSNGVAKNFHLPPGIVVAADFTAGGDLSVLLLRGADNETVLYRIARGTRRFLKVARFPGLFVHGACKSIVARNDYLAVFGTEPGRGNELVLISPEGKLLRLSGLPSKFGGGSCSLLGEDGAAQVVRWEIDPASGSKRDKWLGHRYLIDGTGELVGNSDVELGEFAEIAGAAGTSPDGAATAFADEYNNSPGASPLRKLVVIPARGERRLAQIVGADWTGANISGAVPFEPGGFALLSDASVYISTPRGLCQVPLDPASLQRGRGGLPLHDRHGRTLAIAGSSGRIFIFKLDC